MGRVFSYEEIRQNRVPKAEDFKSAKEITANYLLALHKEGDIVGAQFIGSVAKGVPTRRSDLDVVIITNGSFAMRRIKDHGVLIKNAFHIPFEPIAIPHDLAGSGEHTIDVEFFQHVKEVATPDNVIGSAPIESLNSRKVPFFAIHHDYLIAKLRRLREGYNASGESEFLKIIQRAFESPISVGRRTLISLGIPLVHPKTGISDDGKESVSHVFMNHFGASSIGSFFQKLLEFDREYSDLLEEALRGNVSRQEYNEQLFGEKGMATLDTSLAWTTQVLEYYNKTYEGTRRGVEY